MKTRPLDHVIGDDYGDDELTSRIAEGDLAGLGVLYDRHNADVRRFLGHMGIAACDVEDLVQQTFLEVAKAAQRYDASRASVRAWLFGVAAMVARRHRRSLSRLARLLARRLSDGPGSPDSGEMLASRVDLRRARVALQSLSPKKREVFVMIVIEEARSEEVAAVLGIPLGTVWTRLHHARRELRELLKESAP